MRKCFASCGSVALIIAGVLLSTSCSATPAPLPSDTPASQAKPAASPTTQAKPAASPTATKPSGELKVGISGIFNPFAEPAKDNQSGVSTSSCLVFDSLLILSSEGQPSPGLAERWEIAKDGTSQTFYIRTGVKFHDGSDLTGADVKFSLERFIAPGMSANSNSSFMRAAIAGVDLKDAYTVVVTLKQPLFELLLPFTNYTGAGIVLPKKYIEEKGWDYFAQHPIGSGPWKFVKQVPGNSQEFEAVDSHWRVVPQFKNLTLLSIPEESTRIAMLKTGELDLAQVAPDSAAGLKAAGLRIINHPGGDIYDALLFYDVDNPGNYNLGDVRVRKALSLAVNRQEMADKLFGGAAQPGVVLYAPRIAYFFDSSVLKPDPFDPDQAKKLLADGGRPNGFSMKFWDYGGGGLLSMLDQALVGYWRKIGVNADTSPVDWAVFRPKVANRSPDTWDTAGAIITPGGAVGFENVGTMYLSTGFPKNIKNAQLDDLIRKVPMTADPAEKKKLALQAVVMARDNYGVLTFLETPTPFAVGSKIGSITLIKGIGYPGPAFETVTHAK